MNKESLEFKYLYIVCISYIRLMEYVILLEKEGGFEENHMLRGAMMYSLKNIGVYIGKIPNKIKDKYPKFPSHLSILGADEFGEDSLLEIIYDEKVLCLMDHFDLILEILESEFPVKDNVQENEDESENKPNYPLTNRHMYPITTSSSAWAVRKR